LWHKFLGYNQQNSLLFPLLLMLLFPGAVHADDTASAAEATEANATPTIAKPDLDQAMLGEFAGPVTTAPNKYQPLALQIRPMGNDRFEALQYTGGLPGEHTHRRQSVALIGKRSGDFLVLSGGPWAIFVEKDHCLLLDREGQRVGRLERVVRTSPTEGAPPPKDAIVLFDGSGTDQFSKASMTEDGLLMQGADVKQMFQDFNLHLEFRLPYMPTGRDQGRANSGVYLQSRYEVQILDSFATKPVFNGCAALYRFRQPDVNMCFPPLVWQTYDIIFTAPRWASDGAKMRNGQVTVWHNGVKVHDNVELADKTGAGKTEEPLLLPIRFQDHGNPVRFRNIWIVDRGLAPAMRFPVYPKPAEEKAEKVEEAKKPQPPKKEAPPAKPTEEKPKPAPEAKPAPKKQDVPAEAKPAEQEPKPAAETKKQEKPTEPKPEPMKEEKPAEEPAKPETQEKPAPEPPPEK
jgi:hypothetical protein